MIDLPPTPFPVRMTRDEVQRWLDRWDHPRRDAWLAAKEERGELRFDGDPPTVAGVDVWRLLLREECDKLYNQAYCALDQIQEAENPDDVMITAMDDFPSAVEQAWSLAPSLAEEHLLLLREYKEERHTRFVEELGVGTDREPAERVECLAFWADNAEGITDYRRTLYGVAAGLLAGTSASPAQGGGEPQQEQ